MSELQRFTIARGQPIEDAFGDWCESPDVRNLERQITTLTTALEEARAEQNEALAVMSLLRLHRTGQDWEQPIPSYLLNREYAVLIDYPFTTTEAKPDE